VTKGWQRRVCLFGAVISLLWLPGRASATAPTFLTLQLAHTAETMVDASCQPLHDVITLAEQAARYQAMGIHGVTDTLITSWARQATPYCALKASGGHPIDVASWNEMTSLQRVYGWTFIGGSRTYPNLTTVSATRAKWEVCGSLADIRSHGLVGGQGEFAFPNDYNSPGLEAVALNCGYDFGRDYTAGPNLEMALPIPKPFWLYTYSLNGGACNIPGTRCYSFDTRFRYTDPAVLASRLVLDPGHWKVVQGYNFVTGKVISNTVSWDCTSPNWRAHWSSGVDATEVYCWTDWLSALAHAHTVTWVTPNQMASQRH
jgi:hypothetical protein